MARKKSQKRKGGLAKRGRNIGKCSVYKTFKIRENNKRRKLERHLAKFPQDLKAKRVLEALD